MKDVTLDDASLASSGRYLVTAAQILASNTVAPEVQMQGVTGIAGEVKNYLQSLVLAQLALSDAAKTGSRAVSRMMEESSELDRQIAASLNTGFLVPTGKSEP